MRQITSALVATAAAVLLTSTIAAAQGQVLDSRLTNVTFSGPVTIPGHVLPAGTYHFQLADSQANRNIVEIFDKDNHLMATMLAVPAKRNQPEGDPVITFKETRSDVPPAVHYWYYAGETSGSELVYPKSQAMQIAQASGEPVMSTDTESYQPEDLRKSNVSRVTGEPTTAPDTTTAPQSTAQPTTTPVTTAPTTPTTTAPTTPTTTAPTTPTTTAEQPSTPAIGTSGREELPHTASNLPAIGLIGLLALGAALGLAAARRSLI